MSRRPYVREVPRFSWWLKKRFYTEYMMREATCILIAAYSLMLVIGLWRLSQGEAAYQGYLEAIRSPLGIIFQILVFVFAVYHTVTWFKLAPKGLKPIRMGGEKVKPGMIVTAHYIGWAGVSLVILLIVGVL